MKLCLCNMLTGLCGNSAIENMFDFISFQLNNLYNMLLVTQFLLFMLGKKKSRFMCFLVFFLFVSFFCFSFYHRLAHFRFKFIQNAFINSFC